MLPCPNYYYYYISTPTRIRNNRRKMRWPPTLFTGGGRRGNDELTTVKAAAWAWYQRNEGKPMIREFDLTTRATRTPRPSRYKLEAEKRMTLSENKVSKPYNDPLLRVDQKTQFSSLLDSYEIKSISKRIDEGSLFASVYRLDHGHRCNNDLLQKKLEDESKKENIGLVKKVSMRNLWKGMILMAPRTGCGRSDDVDLGAYRSGPTTVKVAPTTVNRRIHRR